MTEINGQLRSIVERIERIEDERKSLASDIRDLYAEAKSSGFDLPALRAIIRMRKEPVSKRMEREAIIDAYQAELGMLADTPLGQAAIRRAREDDLHIIERA